MNSIKYYTSIKLKFGFFIFLILGICLFASSLVFAKPNLYDSILITVNNRVITSNEIELRLFEESRRRNKNFESKEELKEVRKQIINSLIEESLLDIRADELMIFISEDILEKETVNFRKARKLSVLQFEDFLEQQNLTLTDFKKALKKNYRRNQLLEMEVKSRISLPEAELKEIFQKNNKGNKRINARHILIKLSPKASNEAVEEAKTKIETIKRKIDNGMDFTEAALALSEDPSVKTNKGVLGFFQRQDMLKEFADVAFELPLNKLSDPVRTAFGFHIIEVLDITYTSDKDFEAIRDQLYQKEFQKKFYAKYEDFIKKLKKNAHIVFK